MQPAPTNAGSLVAKPDKVDFGAEGTRSSGGWIASVNAHRRDAAWSVSYFEQQNFAIGLDWRK